MFTFQLKKRLISEEPRAVFDLMRWIPGTPFIASSMGRVTETRVCDAGATPLSTMITMRGKSVVGKIAIGNCHAAYTPPAHTSAISTSIARDWLETKRAILTTSLFLVLLFFFFSNFHFRAVSEREIAFDNHGLATLQAGRDLHFVLGANAYGDFGFVSDVLSINNHHGSF